MQTLNAKIHIAEDGTLTGVVAAGAPSGTHAATILIQDRLPVERKSFQLSDLPRHELGWDSSDSLSRQDLYADDGR